MKLLYKNWILLLGMGGFAFLMNGAVKGEELGKTVAITTFAGGCFWCMEQPFDNVPGVISTISGYAGGSVDKPSYEQVSEGRTGHAESVQVTYDPERVKYEELLAVYWHNIDPTTKNQQFCDHGNQYRTVIFFHDEAQRLAAEASKDALLRSGKFPGGIATEIIPAGKFFRAEDYHQNYYQTNPFHYKLYRYNCGRDQRLQELWGAAAAQH